MIQISDNDVSFPNLDDHQKIKYLLTADNAIIITITITIIISESYYMIISRHHSSIVTIEGKHYVAYSTDSLTLRDPAGSYGFY